MGGMGGRRWTVAVACCMVAVPKSAAPEWRENSAKNGMSAGQQVAVSLLRY